MGGRCYIWMSKSDGTLARILGPSCTDNFQVVTPKFRYSGLEWHSVEQAFQALKFPSDSAVRLEIHATSPNIGESDGEYGLRVWEHGRFAEGMREDWGQEKVKIMLLLNLAKYASSPSFQEDLIATGNQRIEGQESTWEWKYWNSCTQMLIRKLLQSHTELNSVIVKVENMALDEVETLLKDAISSDS